MTKAEKLLQKVRNNPKQVTFAELDTLLRRLGFDCRQAGGGSSHFNYKHPLFPGERITIPYHRPHVKPVYVEHALEMIERVEVAEKKD